MGKVVIISIKGKDVLVKGETNNLIAEQLTQYAKGHYSGYMIKKSCKELEEEPDFTKDHAQGVWDHTNTKIL